MNNEATLECFSYSRTLLFMIPLNSKTIMCMQYVTKDLFLTTFVSVSMESSKKSSCSVDNVPSVLQSSWMSG